MDRYGEVIVPLFAIFMIFGLPISGWIVVSYLRYRERMELIRRGFAPPPSGWGNRGAWRQWAEAQGQTPGPGQPQPPAAGDDPQTALYKGIRLAAIGVALVIGLSFIGGTPGSPRFHGGPWLLGGLIPLFVGLAQMAIALMSGAQFPGARAQAGMPPPPPRPPGPGPVPGPGAWQQPGRRPEELGRPPSPPEVR